MFKIMGISDETTCECCGRQHLKRTVLVGRLGADREVIEVLKFGRDCAARATKLRRTGAAIETLAIEAQRLADEAERQKIHDVGAGVAGVVWIVEEIGGGYEVVRCETLCRARGTRSEIHAWAAKRWPNKCINVRVAR